MGRIAVPTDAADLVYKTPSDYAAFMIEVLRNRGLTPEIAEQRIRPQVSMMDAKCRGAKAAACPPYTGFGLGWQILVFPDGKVMTHNGRDDGLFTFAYLDRSTGDGAVIFTNSENGEDLVAPILEVLGARAAFVRYVRAQN